MCTVFRQENTINRNKLGSVVGQDLRGERHMRQDASHVLLAYSTEPPTLFIRETLYWWVRPHKPGVDF